jgi:hypothetical protein
MTTPLFREVGPYQIERQIGRGMALVFLAHDTRSGGRQVALKVVPDGPDADARDTAAAERRGAELQRALLHESAFVPRVYEIGEVPGYLYIAMEYLEGEDLSAVIRRGPLDPLKAVSVAIQLCRFLEEVDEVEQSADGAAPLTLLHNDLKPTNVRLVPGDAVKILDFGAAKALSMSRRVTRNDFYSTPYLSPECLDSGERDRQTDAWALGVMLYEMVAGHTPFRADDTRRVEARIRSRRPPEPLTGCPRGLNAVIAKLLAARPEARYPSATAVREDLERFAAGSATVAEGEGWPDRVQDEPPTRRVTAAIDDEPATRRASVPQDDEPATRKTARSDEAFAGDPQVAQPEAASAGAAREPKRDRGARWIRAAIIAILLGLVANEAVVSMRARRLSATVPMLEAAGLAQAWEQYQSLGRRSYLAGLGVRPAGSALVRQSLILAERVVENYRTPAPTVREAQWSAAANGLQRALVLDPGNATLRGTLRYAQGHLHRINGEARKGRNQPGQAQREFTEAVAAFREAAALRPKWPDPFLGLARTYIYGIEDLDRGTDAMNEAQRLGHTIGTRETAQLADGFRGQAESLEGAVATVSGMPQEREFLLRARDAYRRALELYETIPTFAGVPARIRDTQRRLDTVERRLSALDAREHRDLTSPPSSPAPGGAARKPGSERSWA